MKYLIVTGFLLIANLAYAEIPTSQGGNLTELCKEDLAKLLGVDKDKIIVKSTENMSWPDSSLGFPERGYSYLAVITEGQITILTYNDKEYEYHDVTLDPKQRKLLEQQK